MTTSARLALTLGAGAVVGALVLLAAVVAGRSQRKWWYGLGGSAWGFALAWLVLTDCMRPGFGLSRLSNAAFPVYFFGLVAWPAALAWRQSSWFRRWIFAQLILCLTLLPAFFLAVLGALCNFT